MIHYHCVNAVTYVTGYKWIKLLILNQSDSFKPKGSVHSGIDVCRHLRQYRCYGDIFSGADVCWHLCNMHERLVHSIFCSPIVIPRMAVLGTKVVVMLDHQIMAKGPQMDILTNFWQLSKWAIYHQNRILCGFDWYLASPILTGQNGT